MSASPPPPAWPPAPVGPPVPPRQPARYSRFTALVLSFFSKPLYRDVARGWRGIGLLYLVLLLALTWLPPILRGHLSFRRFVRDDAPAVVDQVPTLTIRDGMVSIAEAEPYFIRDPETGRAFVYIDTSGAFDRQPEAEQAAILISRSAMEVRQERKTEIHPLSKVEYFYVDKAVAGRWLGAGSAWFGPVAYAGVLSWSLAVGLIRLLLYGLLGLIFASSFNARLDFPALMRLAAVAMTPAMVLDSLAWTFNFGALPCCGWQIVLAVVTLAYTGFAVKANADAGPPRGVYGGYAAPGSPAPYPHYAPPPQIPPPPSNPYYPR